MAGWRGGWKIAGSTHTGRRAAGCPAARAGAGHCGDGSDCGRRTGDSAGGHVERDCRRDRRAGCAARSGDSARHVHAADHRSRGASRAPGGRARGDLAGTGRATGRGWRALAGLPLRRDLARDRRLCRRDGGRRPAKPRPAAREPAWSSAAWSSAAASSATAPPTKRSR